MKPYEKRVQYGAALLDKKKPGWWDGGERKKINLQTLDLGSIYKCVLGQLWGTKAGEDGYSRGVRILTLSLTQRHELGFNSFSNLILLTRRWREEIERRREVARAS